MSDPGGLVGLYCRRYHAATNQMILKRKRDYIDAMASACRDHDFSELVRLSAESDHFWRDDRYQTRFDSCTEPFPIVSVGKR